LITEVVGSEQWITDLTLVKSLAKHADDVALQQRWMGVKLDNKRRLAALIKKLTGATVSTDALFDIQARRLCDPHIS
jgi:starch phosphorylase